MRWSIPRIQTGLSERSRARSPRGDDHRRRAVGDRREVVRAERRGEVRLAEEVVDGRVLRHLRVRVLQRVADGCALTTSAKSRSLAIARIQQRPRLDAGERDRDPSRAEPSCTGRSGARTPRGDAPARTSRTRSRARRRCRRSCSRNQASNSAHAPSISTWLSYTGGHAPTPSMFITNANGMPGQVVAAPGDRELDIVAIEAACARTRRSRSA